jgi:hypothetical protein
MHKIKRSKRSRRNVKVSKTGRVRALALGFLLIAIASAVVLAGHGAARPPSGNLAPALVQSPPLPASSPSKEYIYAGGRLVATEEKTQ